LRFEKEWRLVLGFVVSVAMTVGPPNGQSTGKGKHSRGQSILGVVNEKRVKTEFLRSNLGAKRNLRKFHMAVDEDRFLEREWATSHC
jgi:hypothetical protein